MAGASGVCVCVCVHQNVKLMLKASKIPKLQGGSNMTGIDLCVKKPHCAAAVRP
jgi:hypothetical protein